MEELIKIQEREGKKVVNARELHAFLENKREFAHWIKNRIKRYDFIEGQDFISFDTIVKRETGASTKKEYAITINMAKELCMVENNERGKEARKYFIACEQKLKDVYDNLRVPRTFAEALRLAADQQEMIEKQQQTIEAHETEILALSDKISEMKPKAVYYDQILKSKNTVLVTQIAKDYGYSAYKFNQLLETFHIQYKVREQWVLYAEHSDKGYTKSTSYPVDCHDGTYITKMRTEWTQKGRLFLYEALKANNILPLIEQ